MSNDLQAVIFDVDGTLADTELHGHRVAFNQAFAEAGLDWTWSPALYGELLKVTGGKERIRRYIDEYVPGFSGPADLDGFIAGLHRAKNGHYAALAAAGKIPLRPGVRRLLDEARAAGLRLAIATTTSFENVEALLTHALAADAMNWFEVIAAGDVVPAKKPAPDIYHHTLRELGLPASACLALEDSANGLRSALAAAIPTLVTVCDYTRQDHFGGAALVVDQLGEPGQPFSLIDGEWDDTSAAWIDVAALRRIHRRAAQSGDFRQAAR